MLALALTTALLAAMPSETVTIKHVLASNVVVVQTATEDRLHVTLLGVGTPDTIDARKPEHVLGKSDLLWTQNYLPSGTKVRMERHGTSYTGRVLVMLFRLPDGLCWNEWLVKAGGAYFTTTDAVDFTKQEASAREGRLGIWASLPDRPRVEKAIVAVPVQSSRPASTPSFFTGVAGGTRLHSRPHYVRQNSSQFDAAMGAMMQQTLNPGGYGYGGRGVNPNQRFIDGYQRGDRTFVQGHMRTMPNGTTMDNINANR